MRLYSKVFAMFFIFFLASCMNLHPAPATPDSPAASSPSSPSSLSSPSSASYIKPPALRPGDTIAIVAPASPLEPPGRIQRAAERLKAMGFRVKEAPNLYHRYGDLAGPDDERVENLMAAFRDPEVKAVISGTGGYGVSRILDQLDWNEIARQPKIVTGFSDITALHLALNRKCHWVTFHSPNPMWGLGSETGMQPFAGRYYWRAILASNYFDAASGARLAPGWTYALDEVTTKPVTLVPGVARGRLVGGNLSLVATLMGTPYEIDTRDAILFLEDVGEKPYRVDRMLSQLEMGGKLNNLRGAILGRWSKCVSDEPEKSLTLEQIFDRYFAHKGYPVVTQFPIGHVADNATIPMGVMAELDATTGRLTILEDPVTLP